MGIKEGSVDYYLHKRFVYSRNGQQVEATFVTLREPTADHQDGFWVMSQHVTRAKMSAMKFLGDIEQAQESAIGRQTQSLHNVVDEVESNASEAESLKMLLQAGDSDIVAFMNTFKKMVSVRARKPLALVDGDEKVPLNQTLMNQMHPEDLLNLATRWCAFFIMSEDSSDQTSSDEQPEQHLPVKVV